MLRTRQGEVDPPPPPKSLLAQSGSYTNGKVGFKPESLTPTGVLMTHDLQWSLDSGHHTVGSICTVKNSSG